MSKEEKTEPASNPEIQQLKELYDLMLEKGLDVVELKDEGSRLKLTRRAAGPPGGGYAGFQRAPTFRSPDERQPPAARGALSSAQTIPTPLAGIFYRASSPASPPFVKEGDTVEPGQTLCIVEAMKVMNEIKADSPCRITKILVENGRPIAAGQALFQIERP